MTANFSMDPNTQQTPANAVPVMDVSSDGLLAVRLSAWEWHHFLKEIEDGILCVVNRDQTNARILYSKIATQLAGHEVTMPPQKRPAPLDNDKPDENARHYLSASSANDADEGRATRVPSGRLFDGPKKRRLTH